MTEKESDVNSLSHDKTDKNIVLSTRKFDVSQLKYQHLGFASS